MALKEDITMRTNERIAILLDGLTQVEKEKVGTEIRILVNSLNTKNEFENYDDFKIRLDRFIQIWVRKSKINDLLSLEELVKELSIELLGDEQVNVILKRNNT